MAKSVNSFSQDSAAVSGIGWVGAQQLLSNILSFITYAILARLLSPHDFGLVALANVVIAFCLVFVEQGLSDSLVQAEHVSNRQLSTLFWLNVAVSLVFCFLIVGTASLLPIKSDLAQISVILCLLAPLVTLHAISGVLQAILRRQMQFRIIALRNIATTMSASVAGVAAAFAGWGVWSLVLQQVVGTVSGTATLWIATKWLPKFQMSLYECKPLIHFGGNVLGSGLLNFIGQRGLDGIIANAQGMQALGLYNVACRLCTTALRLVSSPVTSVAFSLVSRLQANASQRHMVCLTLITASAALCFPCFALLLAFATELVVILFGEKWLAGAALVQALSVWACASGMGYLNGTIMRSFGRADIQLKFTIAGVVATILVGVAVAPISLDLLVWMIALVTCSLFTLDVYLVRRFCGISIIEYLRACCIPMSVGGIVYLTGVLLRGAAADVSPLLFYTIVVSFCVIVGIGTVLMVSSYLKLSIGGLRPNG